MRRFGAETLRSAPATWLIDPIAGTANFAVGIPLFGIMVPLVEHGETTQAWIYDPNTREMTIAQRGAGGGYPARQIAHRYFRQC